VPPSSAEGGALYALGLIHTNHGHDVRQFLLDSLRATQHEVRFVCACFAFHILFVWDWPAVRQFLLHSLRTTQHEVRSGSVLQLFLFG